MRLERVVMGMDFSAAAIAGAQWVAEYVAPEAELILVHAVDVAEPPRFLRGKGPDPDALRTAIRDFADRRLREVATYVSSRPVRLEIRDGRAVDVLARVAEDVGADLVSVGPHGDRPGLWSRLGSTAERLVRVSPIHVLVTSGAPHGKPVRLLAAVDESDMTAAVIELARRLATELEAFVDVLHVLNPPAPVATMAAATLGLPEPMPWTADEHVRAAAREWLEAVTREALSGVRAAWHVAYGIPAYEILSAAPRLDSDLIIIGRRGRGRVAPALLGSTVSSVLRGAECPVMVVVDPRDALVG